MRSRRLRFHRQDQHEPDRLILGDNLIPLEATADGSIDLIYIDPPFGTGTVRRGGKGHPHTYLDAVRDPESYVAWIRPRLVHCRRVLAPHGSLFVHLDYRTVHYVKVELDRIFGHRRFINEIIWCYSVGGKSRRHFARKHDTILWYSRTADYAFFPEQVKVARKPASHMRVTRSASGELVQEKTDPRTGKVYYYPVAAGKVPEDWWSDIELLNYSDRERTGWPTQKPERLLERIIKGASAADALVADWFCGSATTGVVAQRLGRRFVLADAQPDAIDCAAKRLEQSGQALMQAGAIPRDIVIESAESATNTFGFDFDQGAKIA